MSMSSLLLLCFFFLFSLLPVGDSAHHPAPAPTAATVAAESQTTTFRPSIVVIVGLLTTIFSLTFLLLLLYLKHCRRRSAAAHPYLGAPVAGRKNSGINRAVIESLPLFRFDSLHLNNNNNKVVAVVEECAVCLTRFEAADVLRLLPKCKHAFHVECVDTWLDAHSTCPLCRYRVDPEDVLLIHHDIIIQLPPPRNRTSSSAVELVNNDNEPPPPPGYRRISGRHSSAGERGSGGGGFLQFLLQQKRSTRTSTTNGGGGGRGAVQYSFRRSLDVVAASFKKKSGGHCQSVTVGCSDRAAAACGIRKDGLLLPTTNDRATRLERSAAAAEEERRKLLLLEHRIIVPNSALPSERQMRWSDVQPSDLLYMQSEMMMIRKLSGGGGRSVINARSVSDITGSRSGAAITTFMASNVMNPLI